MSDRTRLKGPMRGRGDGGVEWGFNLRDRVILLDEPDMTEISVYPSTPPTSNLAVQEKSIIGKTSLGWDKTAHGAENIAGVQINLANPIDIGRFLPLDLIEFAVWIPTLADVKATYAAVMSLGTDISNRKYWLITKAELAANQWFVRANTLATGKDTGNGWNPEAISYILFYIYFNAPGDTLAGMMLDSVIIRGAI